MNIDWAENELNILYINFNYLNEQFKKQCLAYSLLAEGQDLNNFKKQRKKILETFECLEGTIDEFRIHFLDKFHEDNVINEDEYNDVDCGCSLGRFSNGGFEKGSRRNPTLAHQDRDGFFLLLKWIKARLDIFWSEIPFEEIDKIKGRNSDILKNKEFLKDNGINVENFEPSNLIWEARDLMEAVVYAFEEICKIPSDRKHKNLLKSFNYILSHVHSGFGPARVWFHTTPVYLNYKEESLSSEYEEKQKKLRETAVPKITIEKGTLSFSSEEKEKLTDVYNEIKDNAKELDELRLGENLNLTSQGFIKYCVEKYNNAKKEKDKK